MRAVLPPVRFSSPTQRISSTTWTAPAKEGDFVVNGEPSRGVVVKTARERAEAKRAEKLALVREQVESGSLVIRQMTADERRRYPPRHPQPKRRGRA
jgi:hypothetical protein